MGSLKAVVLPFIGTLVVVILNCCKFHAEESVHVANKIETKSNITSPDTKNEALPTKTEALKEENLREEDGGKDDEILLPTIAPATPHFERMVSSSFILVPTLESTQILSSKPKLESSESGSPGETAAVIKEEDGKYTERARDSSQVDEVVFTNEMFEDTSAKLPEPQKHLAAKVKTDQEQEMSSQEKEGAVKEKVKEVKLARDNEIADDMMKLNKDKMLMKENADSKIEQDSVKDVVTSDKKTDKEKGTEIKGENTENSEDSPKRDDAVTKSDENQESEAKETGILESFKDWKEKQETKTVKKHVQEKPVIRTSTKKQPNQKANYASYECGAKVISSNQEAENTGAILNENRDMYMLNPCSCRIWFVIELCEKIKAETVEIANYELFSSTPEKFNVYFSTRYPTREWEFGGSFNGKAKRNLQSFHIEEKFYAKYIKVEMLSHFGKEHYCPLSLVRVFGRSEVEELEDSEDSHSDSDHGNEDAETNVNNNSDSQSKDANVGKGDEKNKNFLKSATDMVIGLVNKATKSFTGMDEKGNDTTLETNDRQGENAQNIPQNENSSAEVSDTNLAEDNEAKPSASVNVTGVPESSEGEVKLEGGASVNVTAEQAKNSTSDLVVLIEGDDADEETDPKLISNKCLFDGELLGDRCANPAVRFWIVYLFVRRMCPLNPEQETSGRIDAMNSTKGDVIKKETVVLLPPDDENVDSTVAETHVKHVADKTKFEATTHEESVANGVSSTPHTPVGSTESSIEETGDEATTRPNEGNLSATTKSETTVTQEVKMTTDLAEQATKPMESSCDKVTADHPDLSLLLSAEQSLKQQANTVTAAAENVNEKTEEVTKLDEKNATPLEATVDDKKTTSSAHVDVLVINYDEQLREGKAEVTEKTEVSGNSEIPGKAEKPGSIDNDAVEKDTVEKITSNSTIIIAPSFSQPSSASHSSQKTSDSLLAVGISSNVSSNSSFSNVEQSVSRASVSESVISNDSFMIKATKVPESTAPLSGMTSVNIEVKESFYAVKEKPESDNYDKETNKNRQENIDATVKIGSGSSGNNKESAILKLKSRVKELETNLSLSTLYLEEMSKRYRTALEEQQKQFKSKINTLNLTVIQNKELIGKQKESIEELTKQVLLLSFHLKNLTDVTKEQYFKISERYVFTCMIEGLIVIILLWTCVRRPRQVPYVEQRRYSAPSAYLNQNGHARSFGPSFANDNDIDDQRPASPTHSLLDNEGTANPVLISVTKRRRQKRKAKQLDDSEFSNAIQSGASNNSETTMVSNTAGVLFSAGKGIFTGLAGAFSKQKRKPIVSRQTRALVDTKFYERIEPAGRSKSLGTIEEHDEVIAPRRNRSFENVRSTKYNKMASRLTNEDKRRG